MAERAVVSGKPVDYEIRPGFPAVRKHAPAAVRRAAAVAVSLAEIVSEHGMREVARQSGLSHSSLSRTISGEIWPSVVTIASVEEAFEVDVWGPAVS